MANQSERPDDASASAFELAGVTQNRAGRTVLDGVTVNLPTGALTALIGPSGAGKTSLLRLLNRLDDPAAGTVRYRGQSLASYPVRALRRRIGFVFQTPTMFAGTAAANLACAAALGGDSVPAERVAAMLETVELDGGYATRDAGLLSGGEKQRVALARALMTEPEVLLLDEPTAALDPEVADRLMRTLRRLREAMGLTIVMVTHRLSEARIASTFAVMLEAGKVVEAGPSAQLFHAPGTPRARAFIHSGEGERVR